MSKTKAKYVPSQVVLMEDGKWGEHYTDKMMDKLEAHKKGVLHSGFVIMVVDRDGIVLGKRADNKHIWPGFWDGTLASHLALPLKDFSLQKYTQAVHDRVELELGLPKNSTKMDPIKRSFFYYKAKCPVTDLYEHEWCDVGLAYYNGVVKDPHNDEISVVKHIATAGEIDRFEFETVTPWFLIFMARLLGTSLDYLSDVDTFVGPERFGLRTWHV